MKSYEFWEALQQRYDGPIPRAEREKYDAMVRREAEAAAESNREARKAARPGC